MSKTTAKILRTAAVLIMAAAVFIRSPFISAYGASVLIEFSAPETIVEGEEFTLEIAMSAGEVIGEVRADFSFDPEVIEFLSGPAVVTCTDNVIHIGDLSKGSSNGQKSYAIKFIAKAKGESKLTAAGKPYVYGDADHTEMMAQVISGTVTVYSAEDLIQQVPTPEPDVTEEPTVTVTPEVTPETRPTEGATGTPEPTKQTDVTDTSETGNLHKNGVFAEKKNYGIVITEDHTYTAVKSLEGLKIPEGYTETRLYIGTQEIRAFQPVSLESGFLLVPLENENREVKWYKYDRVEQTFQRLSNEDITYITSEAVYDRELLKVIEEYENKQLMLLVAVATVSTLCVALAILLVFKSIKKQ